MTKSEATILLVKRNKKLQRWVKMKVEETHQSITRDIYSLPYCHY